MSQTGVVGQRDPQSIFALLKLAIAQGDASAALRKRSVDVIVSAVF
jgi:hypothetical protein